MYCKNCGNEMNENSAVCLNCGVAKETGNKFCSSCGASINENAAVCLACGASITEQNSNNSTGKTKLVAGLLAIFLGHLGIHWFYLGFKNKGILNIVITVASALLAFIGIGILGFIGLWVYNIITAVQIFQDKQKDADNNNLV